MHLSKVKVKSVIKGLYGFDCISYFAEDRYVKIKSTTEQQIRVG